MKTTEGAKILSHENWKEERTMCEKEWTRVTARVVRVFLFRVKTFNEINAVMREGRLEIEFSERLSEVRLVR